MKRQFLLLIAIAVFATAFTTNASGQTGKTVRANVKFDFQIGDRLYPAGNIGLNQSPAEPTFCESESVKRREAKRNSIRANQSNAGAAGKGQTPRLVFLKIRRELFSDPNFSRYRTMGLFDSPFALQRESEKNLASRIPRNN